MLKNTRKICGIAAGLSLVSLWGTSDLPLSIPTAEAVYNSEIQDFPAIPKVFPKAGYFCHFILLLLCIDLPQKIIATTLDLMYHFR